MDKKTRLFFLGLSLIILISVGRYVTKDFQFLMNDFWFTSGFLLLILLTLIDQPHFSKDSNVFINAVTAGVSLLLVPENNRNWIFYVFLGVAFFLAISSYVLMWLRSKPLPNENKFIQFISRICREIGKPQTLFSAFFLWGAINKFGVSSDGFNALLLYWAIFMILSIPSIASILSGLLEKTTNISNENALGAIFGVQSKNTFLVKLFPKRKESIKIFDFVEFLYSIDENRSVRKGLILDTYLLNEQQWLKVLTTTEIDNIFENRKLFQNHVDDIVYKIKETPDTKYLSSFIGIVTKDSSIEKIRFIYNSKILIQEGQLLEVKIGSNKISVFYQIINGITKIEQLENKNETGLIIGEAMQLGTWDNDKVKFEPYGWVPEINSPVYVSSIIKDVEVSNAELKIGHIPNTNFPIIINKDLALTHHTAIIGVTGTGKSVFSRNLIKEYLKDSNVKVICIDFTGEYKERFKDSTPIIDSKVEKEVFNIINDIESILTAPFGKENDDIKSKRQEIAKIMIEQISIFMKNPDSKISIIDLPDVINTSEIFEFIRLFIKSIFYIAKKEKSFGNKVCLVLEEAHTVIPEWNFAGISEKSAQPLLNSIAQIALQGRKYNVGLLVIAQRTANVSKTILTQCNTIVSFQEFDKTSSDFLSNYFGDGIAAILPTLKFRQAVIAGKALKSNVPMIFEVPIINE